MFIFNTNHQNVTEPTPGTDYMNMKTCSNNGIKSNDKFNYETYEELKKRIELALIKYTNYKKVIVVSHGIAISSLTHFNDVIEFCGIREVEI